MKTDSDKSETVAEAKRQAAVGLHRLVRPFFVFDVESIGLHGEGFAVAGGVYLSNGAVQWEFCFCCPMDKAEGLQADRDWVSRNVPVMEETHRDTYELRLAFWQTWEKAKAVGAEMAAECLWPVEARFLQDCIRDDAQRLPTAPYPCHEIASVMLSAGMNPMATYDRTPSELPRHNPLADARQSARLLSEALARMSNGPDRVSIGESTQVGCPISAAVYQPDGKGDFGMPPVRWVKRPDSTFALECYVFGHGKWVEVPMWMLRQSLNFK